MRRAHTVLIRDLGWLVALAETGQVTDAAAVLGTGQPTLSRALARVEDELGARLFERTPSGLELTPVGAVAVAGARTTLAAWERMRSDLTALLNPDAGVVRMAFLDSIATSLVPELLGRVHREAPRLRLELRQEPGHAIEADLASGAIDVAITSPRPAGPFAWRPLQEERLVLVVPPRHRWARRRRVSLGELGRERGDELVTTPVGFGFRDLVDTLLREAGVAVPVAFESQDLATIEGLVTAGLGVAVLPEAFAGRSGSVGISLHGSPRARRTVAMVWRTDREPSPPLARFLEIAVPVG